MRIGVDVRCLMNPAYSGVGIYTLNLLRAVFELDRVNQYVLFYNSSRPVKLPKFDYPNVEYIDYRYPNKLFNLSVNFFNWPKLDDLVGVCDVFLTPNLHFTAYSNRCRKVMVVHDLSFILFPEFFSFKVRLWHKLILSKNYLKQADVIVADSVNTKNNLIDLLKIGSEKIKVIYPGVGNEFKVLDQNDSVLKQVKDKYDLPDKFILYLGSLEPRKNIESIVEAYLGLSCQPEWQHALVIGGGTGWKNKTIHRLVKDYSKIKLIGYVAEKDKPALYNLAEMFIYPSYYEGFGLPPLEAMACGTPVIAGANSSLFEAVDMAGLLVDPYNLNDIRLAIEAIANDNDLKYDLTVKGLQQVKKFKWDKTAQELLECFKWL